MPYMAKSGKDKAGEGCGQWEEGSGLAGPSREQGRLQRMKGREREVCLARFQFPCLRLHFGNSLSSDTHMLFCLLRSSSSGDSQGSCLHPVQHLFCSFCRRITSPLRTEAKKGSTKLWVFNIDSAIVLLALELPPKVSYVQLIGRKMEESSW